MVGSISWLQVCHCTGQGAQSHARPVSDPGALPIFRAVPGWLQKMRTLWDKSLGGILVLHVLCGLGRSLYLSKTVSPTSIWGYWSPNPVSSVPILPLTIQK